MSKKRVYSDDERVIRIWDIETVKDLMSRRQVMQMNNERREELETLWVTEPKYTATASLGSNWGYYVGMDEISRHYVAEYTDTLQKALDEKCAANAAIENIRDNFGYGDLIAHHVSDNFTKKQKDSISDNCSAYIGKYKSQSNLQSGNRPERLSSDSKCYKDTIVLNPFSEIKDQHKYHQEKAACRKRDHRIDQDSSKSFATIHRQISPVGKRQHLISSQSGKCQCSDHDSAE